MGEVWRGVAGGCRADFIKTPEYVITPQQRAFWSFQPVPNPSAPAVKTGERESPIDNLYSRSSKPRG